MVAPAFGFVHHPFFNLRFCVFFIVVHYISFLARLLRFGNGRDVFFRHLPADLHLAGVGQPGHGLKLFGVIVYLSSLINIFLSAIFDLLGCLSSLLELFSRRSTLCTGCSHLLFTTRSYALTFSMNVCIKSVCHGYSLFKFVCKRIKSF